ncbi:hypothetical protein DW975_07585 [Agathobacter rectalis]|uniref:Uncharacterized protein n=1 Tax=Agathobacter rectalis TaxID=39491 RepID=A0A413PGL6_9FIRM|nr:hypothetical protein DW975_07585 [Agathobacter rectalis]
MNGGIIDTFYHQSNNGVISENGLWRRGDVCLKDSLEYMADINKEPSNFMDRIYWNIKRLLEWVDKAEKNCLVTNKDRFELPDIRESYNIDIIFNEDEISYMQWEDSGAKSGIVKLKYGGNRQYFVETFWSLKNNICVKNKWGGYVNGLNDDSITGIWIILDKIPVINIWQVPNTIAELKNILEQNGISWEKDIMQLFDRIRDGKRHPFLIGFPIPEKFFGENRNYHWWSWVLPVLSYGNKVHKGFRVAKKGWHLRDYDLLNKVKKLEWSYSHNWNQRQILNRGMFERDVVKKKYAIIGAGAIGAMISELLVRSGIYRLLIIDGDIISVGNLSRHTLTIKDTNHAKVIGLKKHLESINSHVHVEIVNEYLSYNNLDILTSCDVIIDCTAKDIVIDVLSKIKVEKTIFSVSVGFKAERLYFVYYKGKEFNETMFSQQIVELIEKDKQKMDIEQLPWDGVGCWNPVFPAMEYDMYMAASIAVEMITKLINNCSKRIYTCVFEKKYDRDGMLIGYEKICK